MIWTQWNIHLEQVLWFSAPRLFSSKITCKSPFLIQKQWLLSSTEVPRTATFFHCAINNISQRLTSRQQARRCFKYHKKDDIMHLKGKFCIKVYTLKCLTWTHIHVKFHIQGKQQESSSFFDSQSSEKGEISHAWKPLNEKEKKKWVHTLWQNKNRCCWVKDYFRVESCHTKINEVSGVSNPRL